MDEKSLFPLPSLKQYSDGKACLGWHRFELEVNGDVLGGFDFEVSVPKERRGLKPRLPSKGKELLQMTGEEKFQVDLEGYLVIKNVLTEDEVAEMNEIIDNCDRQGPPSLWGEPFKKLIDHPKVLPYLVELLGENVRLDHDYSLFMEKGQGRGGLHGGEDGGRAGGRVGDHWYKYRDGYMRNGLSVMTYNLADAPAGAGGFACIPGSHKTNFPTEIPQEVRRFERPAHYVAQPPVEAGDVLFFTEALIHGTMPWTADHERRSLLYKYSPGHSAWSGNYYDLSKYSGLTEQQKRMLMAPSVGRRPPVIEVG